MFSTARAEADSRSPRLPMGRAFSETPRDYLRPSATRVRTTAEAMRDEGGFLTPRERSRLRGDEAARAGAAAALEAAKEAGMATPRDGAASRRRIAVRQLTAAGTPPADCAPATPRLTPTHVASPPSAAAAD